MRIQNQLLASLCFAGLAIALLPRECRAVDEGVAFQQAIGSQQPIYKFSPSALDEAMNLCAVRDPEHAGDYVALVLHSGRNDADAIAPLLVQSAIQGLGEDPKASLIAGVVHAAVKAAPSEVLDIVTAAVKASPRAAAPAIVTAAVTAVPHPEEMVTVNTQRRAERALGNDKQLDYKQLPPPEKQLTLAEAIVQAAMDADPSLSVDSLTAAADVALTTGIPVDHPTIPLGVLDPIQPIVPTGPGPGPFSAPGPVSP